MKPKGHYWIPMALLALTPFLVLAAERRRVTMAVSPPNCGLEVEYRQDYGDGRVEFYKVHAERITVAGEPAYQSISVYPDRVRRITMRGRNLTPIYMAERWHDGRRMIVRTYRPGRVHMIRKNLPYPMDEITAVPADIHDPESFAFLLRGYPFAEPNTVAPINVLVAEPNPIYNKPFVLAVNITTIGEEKITVPAGTFDCYVLSMGAAGVLGYLVPENRFWLLKAEPHLIVKATAIGVTLELFTAPANCGDYQSRCQVRAETPPP
jgi:hypothetical protein